MSWLPWWTAFLNRSRNTAGDAEMHRFEDSNNVQTSANHGSGTHSFIPFPLLFEIGGRSGVDAGTHHNPINEGGDEGSSHPLNEGASVVEDRGRYTIVQEQRGICNTEDGGNTEGGEDGTSEGMCGTVKERNTIVNSYDKPLFTNSSRTSSDATPERSETDLNDEFFSTEDVFDGSQKDDVTATPSELVHPTGFSDRMFWMPDKFCKECYSCHTQFTTFVRKHHCRVCGQVFCRQCCNSFSPGSFWNFTGTVRLCEFCKSLAMEIENDMERQYLPRRMRVIIRNWKIIPNAARKLMSIRSEKVNLDRNSTEPFGISSMLSDGIPYIGSPAQLLLLKAAEAHLVESVTAYCTLLNLDRTYVQTLIKLAVMCVTNLLMLEYEELDILNIVKIKKIPGGPIQESLYVSGAVFTSFISRKAIFRRIHNCQILLISEEISYIRDKTAFSSLDLLVEQEDHRLLILIRKIKKMNPHLIVCNKSVNRLLLDELLKLDILVLVNVPLKQMRHISRCTGAVIIPSIDFAEKIHLRSIIGLCGSFEIRRFEGNANYYVVLSDCQPKWGCTICLRSPSSYDANTAVYSPLSRAKKALKWTIRLSYSLALETRLVLRFFCGLPPDAKGEAADTGLSNKLGLKYKGITLQKWLKLVQSSPGCDLKYEEMLIRVGATKQEVSNKFLEEDGGQSVGENTYDLQRFLERCFQWEENQKFDYQYIVLTDDNARCVNPQNQCITPFSKNDISLQDFLMKYCFKAELKKCSFSPSCTAPFSQHILCFQHFNRRLLINVKELNDSDTFRVVHSEDSADVMVWWQWCKICKREVTPRIPLVGGKFSFCKFLDLFLLNSTFVCTTADCNHLVFRDHIIYVSNSQRIVSMRWETFKAYALQPSPTLSKFVAPIYKLLPNVPSVLQYVEVYVETAEKQLQFYCNQNPLKCRQFAFFKTALEAVKRNNKFAGQFDTMEVAINKPMEGVSMDVMEMRWPFDSLLPLQLSDTLAAQFQHRYEEISLKVHHLVGSTFYKRYLSYIEWRDAHETLELLSVCSIKDMKGLDKFILILMSLARPSPTLSNLLDVCIIDSKTLWKFLWNLYGGLFVYFIDFLLVLFEALVETIRHTHIETHEDVWLTQLRRVCALRKQVLSELSSIAVQLICSFVYAEDDCVTSNVLLKRTIDVIRKNQKIISELFQPSKNLKILFKKTSNLLQRKNGLTERNFRDIVNVFRRRSARFDVEASQLFTQCKIEAMQMSAAIKAASMARTTSPDSTGAVAASKKHTKEPSTIELKEVNHLQTSLRRCKTSSLSWKEFEEFRCMNVMKSVWKSSDRNYHSLYGYHRSASADMQGVSNNQSTEAVSFSREMFEVEASPELNDKVSSNGMVMSTLQVLPDFQASSAPRRTAALDDTLLYMLKDRYSNSIDEGDGYYVNTKYVTSDEEALPSTIGDELSVQHVKTSVEDPHLGEESEELDSSPLHTPLESPTVPLLIAVNEEPYTIDASIQTDDKEIGGSVDVLTEGKDAPQKQSDDELMSTTTQHSRPPPHEYTAVQNAPPPYTRLPPLFEQALFASPLSDFRHRYSHFTLSNISAIPHPSHKQTDVYTPHTNIHSNNQTDALIVTSSTIQFNETAPPDSSLYTNTSSPVTSSDYTNSLQMISHQLKREVTATPPQYEEFDVTLISNTRVSTQSCDATPTPQTPIASPTIYGTSLEHLHPMLSQASSVNDTAIYSSLMLNCKEETSQSTTPPQYVTPRMSFPLFTSNKSKRGAPNKRLKSQHVYRKLKSTHHEYSVLPTEEKRLYEEILYTQLLPEHFNNLLTELFPIDGSKKSTDGGAHHSPSQLALPILSDDVGSIIAFALLSDTMNEQLTACWERTYGHSECPLKGVRTPHEIKWWDTVKRNLQTYDVVTQRDTQCGYTVNRSADKCHNKSNNEEKMQHTVLGCCLFSLPAVAYQFIKPTQINQNTDETHGTSGVLKRSRIDEFSNTQKDGKRLLNYNMLPNIKKRSYAMSRSNDHGVWPCISKYRRRHNKTKKRFLLGRIIHITNLCINQSTRRGVLSIKMNKNILKLNQRNDVMYKITVLRLLKPLETFRCVFNLTDEKQRVYRRTHTLRNNKYIQKGIFLLCYQQTRKFEKPTNALKVEPMSQHSSYKDWSEESRAVIRKEMTDSSRNHITVDCEIHGELISVTLYYATQFHALRHYLCGDDLNFVRSIARTSAARPAGGKSGASFTLSHDRRFLFKEINKSEFNFFCGSGLEFFKYFNKAFFDKLPCTILPIYGIFQIERRNRSKGIKTKKYYLVNENLTYGYSEGSQSVHVFDLKGAGRTRYFAYRLPPADDVNGTEEISNTGKTEAHRFRNKESKRKKGFLNEMSQSGSETSELQLSTATAVTDNCIAATDGRVDSKRKPRNAGEKRTTPNTKVLWDQNYREYTGGYPLFVVARKDKEFIDTAVDNDADFLAKLSIVDYSLLLLVDENMQTIRMGVIDYLRPYTWDKQVETISKTLIMRGGSLPTVISPNDYHHRFRTAMHLFFGSLVPAEDADAIESFVDAYHRHCTASQLEEDVLALHSDALHVELSGVMDDKVVFYSVREESDLEERDDGYDEMKFMNNRMYANAMSKKIIMDKLVTLKGVMESSNNGSTSTVESTVTFDEFKTLYGKQKLEKHSKLQHTNICA